MSLSISFDYFLFLIKKFVSFVSCVNFASASLPDWLLRHNQFLTVKGLLLGINVFNSNHIWFINYKKKVFEHLNVISK